MNQAASTLLENIDRWSRKLAEAQVGSKEYESYEKRLEKAEDLYATFLNQPKAAIAPQGDTTPDKKASINYALAVNLAATESCRQFLDEFKKQFVHTHSMYESSKTCSHILMEDASVLSVFHHYEKCPGVTLHTEFLLGGDLSTTLDEMNIQTPSDGSFRSLYRTLSEAIHKANWLEDDRGRIVIPNNLDLVQKRFIIRFFMSKHRSCAIPTNDGGLRDPYSDEITTPEKNKKSKT